MVFFVMACVTEETFPEAYADAFCYYAEVECGAVYSTEETDIDGVICEEPCTCADVETIRARLDYIDCAEEWNAALAADCLAQAEAADHCGSATEPWDACDALRCR